MIHARLLTALAAASVLILSGCATVGVEEPAFSVVRGDRTFEIRDYAPTIVAETTMSGEAVKARNDGFMPLADYIFAKDRKGEKNATTASVTQAPREKIAMTAPVTQQPVSSGIPQSGLESATWPENWKVSFTMPAGYTLDTLPPPANPDVQLIEKPARRMAVLSFSGFAGADRMADKRRDLLDRIARDGLSPVGEPVFAFYDPPWTLPFLRRNEVMVEISAS